jgi:hypothetical protein
VSAEMQLPADWHDSYFLKYGESSNRLVSPNKDTTLKQQRGGSDLGLIADVRLLLLFPRRTHQT